MNTKIYRVNLRMQSECGKKRTRTTPNTETFDAVKSPIKIFSLDVCFVERITVYSSVVNAVLCTVSKTIVLIHFTKLSGKHPWWSFFQKSLRGILY